MSSVNVLDYGADPTGSGSSSTAFRNASAAAVSQHADTIIIPAGTYLISEPFSPPANTTVAGAGIDTTTIRIRFSDIGNFPFLAAIQGSATNPNVTVQDMTINGGRSDCGLANLVYDPVLCPQSYGGGISLDVGWTVQRCRFTNINYFKTSLFGAHNATIQDCHFDNRAGSTSGDNDQIGGGSGVANVTIQRNTIESSCVGSGIDLTNASEVKIIDNQIRQFSLILEGVTTAEVRGNFISGGGSINLKSNAQYASALTNGVLMPRKIRVVGNTIIGSTGAPGIVLSYAAADKANVEPFIAGGGNRISDNICIQTLGMGIIVFGSVDKAKSVADVIERNTIIDVTAGSGTYNSGAGTFATCGIGISIGTADQVISNIIKDTRVSPPLVHGVTLGGRTNSSRVRQTLVMGTTMQGATGFALNRV